MGREEGAEWRGREGRIPMKMLSELCLALCLVGAGSTASMAQVAGPMTPPMQPGMMQGEGGAQPPAEGRQGMMQQPGGPMGPDMMRMMGAMRADMHQAVLRLIVILIDTDGDGALSLPELRAVQERLFDNVDANNDDRVTLEEFAEFWHGSTAR
jgi:hypothetical protein